MTPGQGGFAPDLSEENSMNVQATSIQGLLLIKTKVIEDGRGFFLESYKDSALQKNAGRTHKIAQSNHSRSRVNTLRGFHMEAWDKLVYVVRGTALCVVADARPESSTFGRHERFLLGDPPGKRHRIFIPVGLCNAFFCLSEVDYVNDVSDEFDPDKRKGIRWDDPTIGVEWPTEQPVLSEADSNHPSLRETFPEHLIFGGTANAE